MNNFSLLSFLEVYLTLDEPFILWCSTGADSMFLLHQILKTPYKKNLVATYFNHHTRSQCEEEANYLLEFGKQENFTVEIWGYDFSVSEDSGGKSFEALAREKRYEYFRTLKRKYGAQKILLAHHFDDRVETMIFHMLRGTKLSGLINMQEVSNDIYRPLLKLQKSDILQYLQENNISYFEDRSNASNDYTRNFIRNEIVSHFSDVHPEYRKNIWNLLTYFEDLEIYLRKQVEDFLWGKNYFSIPDFAVLSTLLQKEILKHIFFVKNNHSTLGLSEANITEILRFLSEKRGNWVKKIHWLELKKEKGKVYF